MRRSSLAATFGVVVFALACGGGNGSTGPNNPNPNATGAGSMSASIDGSGWNAIGVSASRSTGLLIIAGSDVQRTVTVSFALNGTGTQTFGPGGVALGVVLVGGQSWQANGSGLGSGSVNITTLTGNRAVGTFSFTAVGGQGATPASRQVTNGRFDVRY